MASCSARIVTALPAPQPKAVAAEHFCARSLALGKGHRPLSGAVVCHPVAGLSDREPGGSRDRAASVMTDEDAKRIADALEKLTRTAAKIEDALKVGGALKRLATALERRNGFP